VSRSANVFESDNHRSVRRRATRDLAIRLAEDIQDGWFVNLGIGKPTTIADVVDLDREIIFHSENGLVGMGRYAEGAEIDTELINAGKEHVTMVKGASIVHHSDSFALVRGGHLDLTVMGAFQVAQNGDFANWTIPGEKVPAVGGAMDLAVGAKRVWVMMDLFDRGGTSKLCDRCWYPLTAQRAVQRVYTDLAVFDIAPEGFVVQEIVDGLSFDELQRYVPVDLEFTSTASTNFSQNVHSQPEE
jgi:3-oxoadipate CoA-transferase, beta subunit